MRMTNRELAVLIRDTGQWGTVEQRTAFANMLIELANLAPIEPWWEMFFLKHRRRRNMRIMVLYAQAGYPDAAIEYLHKLRGHTQAAHAAKALLFENPWR